MKLIDAAQRAGIRRYVMVSSIGAHDPEAGPSRCARTCARRPKPTRRSSPSGLDHTIVRPGSLSDDPGTGPRHLSTDLGNRGPIPRDDVAAVLAACLDVPETIGLTFEAFAGDQEVDLAVRALARG